MPTLTAPATTGFNETDHPRIGDGSFTDKNQSAPEVTLGAAVETVFTKKYDTVAEKIKAFHEELEGQVAALADDENWNDYLNTMGAFHKYSMYNQLLIQLQHPGATRVGGFRKWKEFERNVKKGEKGISILAPAVYKDDAKDGGGNVIIGSDGKPEKTSRIGGFTTRSVFDVSQTEGKPLPDIEHSLSEDSPDGFIDDLEQSIRDAGFTVSYEAMPGSKSGYTSPDGNRVVVDEALTGADRARVLAHERGHIACGHLERLDEYHTGHDGGHRGSMEVEAESFAYVICRANGMTPAVGNVSSTYVAGWDRTETQGDKAETVKKSAETIAKAVKAVLGSDVFVSRDELRESEAQVA
jgi:antirestriction protein ArdC